MNSTMPFDPNNDRLARDIRNALSKALVAGLDRLDIKPADDLAAQYLSQPLGSVYHNYIRQRLDRYRQALNLITKKQLTSPFEQAVILWNLGLFFEVHERLEGLWIQAAGRRRLALQALIRAAGVYVHLGHGKQSAAVNMAGKAVAGLTEFGDALPELGNTKTLIESLNRQDPTAPELSLNKT